MEVGADPQTTPHGFPWHCPAFLCGFTVTGAMVWPRVSQCESAGKDTHQAQSSCTHDTGLHSDVQHQLRKHLPIIPLVLLAPVKDLVDCHHFCMSSSLEDKNKFFSLKFAFIHFCYSSNVMLFAGSSCKRHFMAPRLQKKYSVQERKYSTPTSCV